jgi:nitrous oxide reductase accessory protein NosL
MRRSDFRVAGGGGSTTVTFGCASAACSLASATAACLQADSASASARSRSDTSHVGTACRKPCQNRTGPEADLRISGHLQPPLFAG